MKKFFLYVAVATPVFIAGYWSAIYIVDDKLDEMRSILSLANEKMDELSYISDSVILDEKSSTLRYLLEADRKLVYSDEIVRDYVPIVEQSISEIEGRLEHIRSEEYRKKLKERIELSREKVEDVKFDFGMQ